MRQQISDRRKGNVFVEFALGLGLTATLASGGVELGLTIQQYNQLQGSVREAARYGASRPRGEIMPGRDWERRVRNVAVYGAAQPGPDALAVVPGLEPDDIAVEIERFGPEIDAIRVGVREYRLKGVFSGIQLESKPAVVFPYLGGYTP